GFDGEICVVAEEEWDFYERPPLSKASLLEPDAGLPRQFSDQAPRALNLTRDRPLRAQQKHPEAKNLGLIQSIINKLSIPPKWHSVYIRGSRINKKTGGGG
ncbi:hypothetical protein ACVGWE_05345, partial [Enterobacter mori]